MLPMWMNFLLRTYAMMTLLERNGVINTVLEALGLPKQQMIGTEGAVLLGMVYNFLPFMILPIYTVLKKMDRRVIEAAEDLGAPAGSSVCPRGAAAVGAGRGFGHHDGVHAGGHDVCHFPPDVGNGMIYLMGDTD